MASGYSLVNAFKHFPRALMHVEHGGSQSIPFAIRKFRLGNGSTVQSFRSLTFKPRAGQSISSLHRSMEKSFIPPILSHQLCTKLHAGVSSGQNGDGAIKTRYDWIDKEATELIGKAYKRHKALADKSESFPPSLSVQDLERIGTPVHYAPKDFVDRVALNAMKILRVFVHAFFREKYDHHAVCLETVAAIPGLVGSFHRHLRSLRRMKRDHGWISVMQEEAENERMHLLIFMKITHPSALERGLVILAQGLYLTFYSGLYLFMPRAAHRLTGYLEEEAHRAYTEYLECIDNGKLKNKPAPEIAKNYYHLPKNATMRDVILHVRADEAMHRDVNHHFGNKYRDGDTDSPTHAIGLEHEDVGKRF
ncbi:unnamed protein product [Agarophyton chilense]|eukprot:gb/GEZJ01000660.1/.p2 GENE.gb/GEZJ01000660.1/~~gb/GEZJ01000660.1/.p2  ORF type:complete len:364 (-),score=58.00 gb/GEZJ01000660.1/:6917-8008(-)